MADIFSIILFVAFFFLGIQSPKKAGWATLIFVPLLGPTALTLAGSSLIPLTIYRVGFAITLGVVVSKYGRNFPVKLILHSNFVKLLIVFSLFVVVVSLQDRSKNIIFSYIPNLYYSLVLCFIIIRTERDLRRLTNIFVFHAFIISVFVIIEYYGNFNLALFIANSIPGFDIETTGIASKTVNVILREGAYRPAGIDGNPVPTSFRLAFLMPLTMWYINYKKFYSVIPLITVFIALMFLQTRASWIASATSFVVLIYPMLSFRYDTKIKKRIILLLFTFLLMVILLFLFNYDYYIYYTDFFRLTFYDSFDLNSDYNIGIKIARLPIALTIFLKSPIWGYLVSPQFVYHNIMLTHDLPAPFIYLLSGGVLLLFLFLSVLFYMPISTLKLSKMKSALTYQKSYLLFAAASFTGGIIGLFSVNMDGHLLILYMLYISIYKIYCFNYRYNHIPGNSFY